MLVIDTQHLVVDIAAHWVPPLTIELGIHSISPMEEGYKDLTKREAPWDFAGPLQPEIG